MLLLQLTGLSGAGKTTLACAVQQHLLPLGFKVELIDGDVYRQTLCRDLGFSKADRVENIRRLGFVGLQMMRHEVIVLLAAINPYETARAQLAAQSPNVKTIYVACPIPVLTERDTKGLYRRAALPPDDPQHVAHFTGVSDPYEVPLQPDLTIDTSQETIENATQRIIDFILKQIKTD